jgi:hypothetical protein
VLKKPAPAKSAEAVRAETIARKSLRKPSAPGVEELKFGIESAFERRATLDPARAGRLDQAAGQPRDRRPGER